MIHYIGYTKKFKIPLFWKFTIAIVTIVILFGSINTILIYKYVKNALEEESKKRGLFIAKSLAGEITSAFLFEDYVSLQNAINNVKYIDSSISYIFLLSGNNKTIVHTFENNFPEQLIYANIIPENSDENFQLIKFKAQPEHFILDIAVPIINPKVGTVRLGIEQSALEHDVYRTVNVFWLMVGLFLTVGLVGAFVFAKFITDPIKAIQNVADKIDLSQIGKQEIPKIAIRQKFMGIFNLLFRAEDEIDILANKFNQMIVRLENTYLELLKTQNHLLQSAKLATVGTLTAGLVHEINNPIAGIQNCIRRIKADPTNTEQNKKYLELMEKAINKVEIVVSNLLNFSRRPSGDYSKVSLNKIVENALLLVGHRLEEHRIAVSNNLDSNLPLIEGNKNELEQVFVNLFINAIDAIEENCKVSSTCERRLVINSFVKGSEIEIDVIDSGKGIPNEHLDKLSDPFFTTKEGGKGTGLGLSIVYKIINAHNGRIEIESVEGKGTKVILKFKLN